MSDSPPAKPVERLFPFVLKSRALLVGRDTLERSKSKLHFVLITRDISENSREQILTDFAHYPVVQHYTEADLEKHFGLTGAKVVGFAKSGLAQSIYAELKEHRINQPLNPTKPAHMPYRPQKLEKTEPEPGEPRDQRARTDQRSDLRRREMATRSTLSRLRNRKSDLK